MIDSSTTPNDPEIPTRTRPKPLPRQRGAPHDTTSQPLSPTPKIASPKSSASPKGVAKQNSARSRWLAITFVLVLLCALFGMFVPFQMPSVTLWRVRRKGGPHFVYILWDDLGYDTTITYSNTSRSTHPHAPYTKNMMALRDESILLSQHYVSRFCSPTRRSLMTGRLSIHHSEKLAEKCREDMFDTRYRWYAEQLWDLGYTNYFLGKFHMGCRSMYHLPLQHGFDYMYGFLHGMDRYESTDRWENNHPVHYASQFESPPKDCRKGRCFSKHSSLLWGDMAAERIRKHAVTGESFHLYLPLQAPHGPYEEMAPGSPDGATSRMSILWAADQAVGKVVRALKDTGLWESTLLVTSSDNGGIFGFSNYPLRGTKGTNYQGGVRSPALVAGGLVPAKLRGTTNNMAVHISDWYSTFLSLAGIESPSDNPPKQPKDIDLNQPPTPIYGDDSYPSLDSVNIWPMLMNPEQYSIDSAHPVLPLSRESILIRGRYKLILGQPWDLAERYSTGWDYPHSENKEEPLSNDEWPCSIPVLGPDYGLVPVRGENDYRGGCLFDIRSDEREKTNIISTHDDIAEEAYTHLKRALYSSRMCDREFTESFPPTSTGRCSLQENLGRCPAIDTCVYGAWQYDYPDSGAEHWNGRVEPPVCGANEYLSTMSMSFCKLI